MPFSNEKQRGVREPHRRRSLAKDFGATVHLHVVGTAPGLHPQHDERHAGMEGRCDIVMGVPDSYDLVRTTRPYYRSTYVFVSRRDKGLTLRPLDDPALKKLKIGVHLLGDDYTNPPPVHELGKRHIVDNVEGFSTFYFGGESAQHDRGRRGERACGRGDRVGARGRLLRRRGRRCR